jgi:cytohesin
MHLAAGSSHTEFIVECLRRNPDQLSAQRADGCTPLHVAVVHGQLRALALLLSFCCLNLYNNVHRIRNKDGKPPYELSQGTGLHTYLVGYSIFNNSPMHVAALNGDVEMIQFLSNESLVQGTVNFQRFDGATPLHVACLAGQGGAVAALLLADANPDITDQNNETPLDWADVSENNLPDRAQILRWLCLWHCRLWTLVLLECSSRLSSR